MFLNSLYYKLKPIIPRRLQIEIRRQIILRKRVKYAHVWPIDEKAALPPEGWTGWPDGKKFALVLTHDVETAEGQDKCLKLMELEKSLGFRSSFNFIAEDYRLFPELRLYLEQQGFEVGVHGLHHNVNLFKSKTTFQESAKRINQYLKDWQSVGFRAPSMYHNLDWIGDLDIQYDSSTFDTDPFEPQPDGVGTIFPFWVSGNQTQKGYIELPYTLPQDHSLFVIMGEKNIDIWKQKLDWIAEHGGMALLITHPDYMNFSERSKSIEKYPVEYYRNFLDYLRKYYTDQYWLASPNEVTKFWRDNNTLKEKDNAAVSIPPELKKTENSIPDQRKTTIWIDFDNSPHVPFFRPIIRKLEEIGYSVVLTGRDCFQVRDLAEMHNLECEIIGRHYGRHKLLKVIGLFVRAMQLAPIALRERPDLALSHGSRSQILISRLLRIPSLVLTDYEYAKELFAPTWVMVPDVIPPEAIPFMKERILKYPGIKEDVYVPNFKPDPSIKKELELNEGDLVVTVRPPATEAHYFKPESEGLFEAVVDYLGNQDHLKIIILPRNERQEEFIKCKWDHLISKKILKIPPKVVDGLNLIWYSDLVVSGGGTMNREAAALGVPVYSIFRGKIGAVDKYLSGMGRLKLIEGVEQIETKIILRIREKEGEIRIADVDALKKIVKEIKRIADGG
jgi:predicted glycosyltransferase